MTKLLTAVMTVFWVLTASAAADGKQDILIKFSSGILTNTQFLSTFTSSGAKVEFLNNNWARIESSNNKITWNLLNSLKSNPSVEYVQPNYKIKLLQDYKIQDPLRRAAVAKSLNNYKLQAVTDNPPIKDVTNQGSGSDPLLNKQWGMNDIGGQSAWGVTLGNPKVIVAVIDTGVDYNHEDLVANMWRNSKEIPNNNIDDDKNGYVDDIVGWDFAANDNKPYDLYTDPMQLLVSGGNPGHGTHCAGNVAARGNNGIGISGVAPNVSIMAIRFISEKGQGTTADAIKSIQYAVDNGAKVLSNSWGSEGEDPESEAENKALRDAVQYAQDKGVLFIAAAGNGHNGVGYDNDNDSAPAYPASYDHDNIISVAALNSTDGLGEFSNWGAKSVDIGAPGVKVFSTVPDGKKYNDYVINMGGFEVTWDGTSMACPHVAGAAALYWSAYPNKTWQEVKAAIINSAKTIPALNGKSVSNGKLDLAELMKKH